MWGSLSLEGRGLSRGEKPLFPGEVLGSKKKRLCHQGKEAVFLCRRGLGKGEESLDFLRSVWEDGGKGLHMRNCEDLLVPARGEGERGRK